MKQLKGEKHVSDRHDFESIFNVMLEQMFPRANALLCACLIQIEDLHSFVRSQNYWFTSCSRPYSCFFLLCHCLLFFGHKDPCNLDWSEVHCIAKTDLELVIPWPLLPVGFQAYIITTDLCDVRSRTQGSMQDRQAFCSPPPIFSPFLHQK